MQKIIKEVDQKRGIMQVTVADERWYLKPKTNEVTGLPEYEGVPSVTWIAGFYPKGIGFYKWLADKGWDEAEAVKAAAGDKGSAVHAALEMIVNGLEFRIDTKVADRTTGGERELTVDELECVKAFCDWRTEMEQSYTVETVASEITVFSGINGYAGTIDWVVRLTPKAEGKNPLKLEGATLFLVDFKTSQQIWTEYELQTSAYWKTIVNGENALPGKMDVSNMRVAILQVGYRRNKNLYKWTEIENLDDNFDMFLTAKKIWKRETEGQEIKRKDFPLVLSAFVSAIRTFVSPKEVEVLPEKPKKTNGKGKGSDAATGGSPEATLGLEG